MMNYNYHYAEIDPETNMCVGVQSQTDVATEEDNLVEIPEYDDVFLFKYYDWNTGKWYYDEEMTEEFIYE